MICIRRCGGSGEKPPLLTGFDDCDCYADKPFIFWYRRLDAEYPGSRFIPNTRDNAAWIESRVAHTERWNRRSELHVQFGIEAKLYRESRAQRAP
jgi:hypothetical protein